MNISSFVRLPAFILYLMVSYNVTGQKPDSLVSGHEIGNIAPEIRLFDTTNKEHTLSELRGKLVLIHFWSSVCNHCKIENPKLVGIYNRYKDKSFTTGETFDIFSVSIDVAADQWKAAIVRDHMPWKYQLCSRMGWQSEVVKLYDFHKTPSTFLIDKDGIIIAKNLWGQELEDKLHELMK